MAYGPKAIQNLLNCHPIIFTNTVSTLAGNQFTVMTQSAAFWLQVAIQGRQREAWLDNTLGNRKIMTMNLIPAFVMRPEK